MDPKLLKLNPKCRYRRKRIVWNRLTQLDLMIKKNDGIAPLIPGRTDRLHSAGPSIEWSGLEEVSPHGS